MKGTPLSDGLTVEKGASRSPAGWWNTLNDPELSGLIERAVAGNRDLKKAKARVREACARRGITPAELFPAPDASATATRSRGSEDTGNGATGSIEVAGLDAGWERDLFGGARRSTEAAGGPLWPFRMGRKRWIRHRNVSLAGEHGVFPLC